MDDPIFELVPHPFQEIVDRCYSDMGHPAVEFESFWEIYCDLRDRVEATIPHSIVTSLNQSIFSEPGEDEDVPFTLAHLRAPKLDMRNAVDTDGEDEDLPSVSFTIDDNQDQLY